MLFQTSDNPLPAGAEAGFFTARDGARLRYGLFAATTSRVRGTVIVLPGRLSFIEKYFEIIGDLAALGFNVALIDVRGQGGSQRPLANPQQHHMGDFGDYLDDIRRFADAHVFPWRPGPYHLLGHSSGGLIALMMEPVLRGRLDRIATVTPLLGHRNGATPLIRGAATALTLLGLESRYAGGGDRRRRAFAGNKLSTDARRFERTENFVDAFPVLAVGDPTIGYLRHASAAIQKVWTRKFIAAVRTPILFIAAGGDLIVSSPLIKKYAGRLPDAEFVQIEAAKHDVLQEVDLYRNQALAAIDRFLG